MIHAEPGIDCLDGKAGSIPAASSRRVGPESASDSEMSRCNCGRSWAPALSWCVRGSRSVARLPQPARPVRPAESSLQPIHWRKRSGFHGPSRCRTHSRRPGRPRARDRREDDAGRFTPTSLAAPLRSRSSVRRTTRIDPRAASPSASAGSCLAPREGRAEGRARPAAGSWHAS